jgi:hypothetical protein
MVASNHYDRRKYKKKEIEWEPASFMMSGMGVNRTKHHNAKQSRSANGDTLVKTSRQLTVWKKTFSDAEKTAVAQKG